MRHIFKTKKTQVFEIASRYYRALWESGKKVGICKMSYYSDYIRMFGEISGINYQVHVNSSPLSDRCARVDVPIYETDEYALKVFAVACACADLGYYFKKYGYLSASLVLNF